MSFGGSGGGGSREGAGGFRWKEGKADLKKRSFWLPSMRPERGSLRSSGLRMFHDIFGIPGLQGPNPFCLFGHGGLGGGWEKGPGSLTLSHL